MRIRFDIHLKKNHHRCERKMDQQINIVWVQHELNFDENAAHNWRMMSQKLNNYHKLKMATKCKLNNELAFL